MKNVLIIEDDKWMADLYRDTLEASGSCKVEVANSAHEAFSIFDDKKIDLIVLDIYLQDHNGIAFLHELASYSDINVIPVVVLSSLSKHETGLSEQRWLHYGVQEYLYKPNTKPKDLIATVRKLLIER